MSGIEVHSPTGVTEVPVGAEVWVGRDADITLLLPNGNSDRYLHARAFVIRAFEDRFSIAVPSSKHWEVLVRERDGRERVVVRPGAEHAFSWPGADVMLETAAHRWHLNISAAALTTPAPVAVASRTSTDPPPFTLTVENADHRAVIAACRDRLSARAGRALDHAAVADLLATAGRWEDAELSEAAARKRWNRAFHCDIEGYLEMSGWCAPADRTAVRDEVVDLLVRLAVVGQADYDDLFVREHR